MIFVSLRGAGARRVAARRRDPGTGERRALGPSRARHRRGARRLRRRSPTSSAARGGRCSPAAPWSPARRATCGCARRCGRRRSSAVADRPRRPGARARRHAAARRSAHHAARTSCGARPRSRDRAGRASRFRRRRGGEPIASRGRVRRRRAPAAFRGRRRTARPRCRRSAAARARRSAPRAVARATFIRERSRGRRFTTAVVGMSGGVDSAVTAYLARARSARRT